MNLYFNMFNHHKPTIALLVSILVALLLGIANYPIALAQTIEKKDYVLYSASPTHIQVVPLVTTGLPDLTTGITVTTTISCFDDPRPPMNIILPLTGDWISIWLSETGEKACYSRFVANSSGSYDETQLGTWPYLGRVMGTDDFNNDGYDDLMLVEKLEQVGTQGHYQYHTVLGLPDSSFDYDTFTPQIYSPNTWWSRAILADINDDGHSDFVYWAFPTGGAHGTTLQMLAGNGDGTFGTTPQTFFSSPHGANSISLADFDQNGHDDIYLAPDDDVSDMGESHMALSNGSTHTLTESIDFRPNHELPTGDAFSASAIAYDINLDGYLDLMTWQAEWGIQMTYEVYWGDGTGTFTPPGEMVLPAYVSGDLQAPTLTWGQLRTIDSESSTPSNIIIGNPDGSTLNMEQGQTFKTPVTIHGIPEGTNIGSVKVDIHYDDTLFKPSSCKALSLDKFSIMCDTEFTSGTVQLNGLSRESGFDNVDLVEIEWEAIGSGNISNTLRLDMKIFTDNNGLPLPYTIQEQVIHIDAPPAKIIIGNPDGSAVNVAEGQETDIPVIIHEIPTSDEAHVAIIKISYDASALEPVSCHNHPDADFDTMLCNLTFAPGVIRINGVSTAGVSGDVGLALIKWRTVGSPGDTTTLEADVSALGDLGELPTSHTTQGQLVHITPMGDVNCDGVLDGIDALLILRRDTGVLGDSHQCPAEPGMIYLPACDVSDDDDCGVVDALFILQCDVGKPNPLCPVTALIDDGKNEELRRAENQYSTVQQNSATPPPRASRAGQPWQNFHRHRCSRI